MHMFPKNACDIRLTKKIKIIIATKKVVIWQRADSICLDIVQLMKRAATIQNNAEASNSSFITFTIGVLLNMIWQRDVV